MLQLQELISYFENSALADNIRENDLLFPLIEWVHVVSICLVVGSILVVDLRLLGLASLDRSVSRVTRGILPLTWFAFAVAVASGSLLFISNATKYLENGYFVAKLLSDRRGRPEHGDLSCHQRQEPAAMGEPGPAAAASAARRGIVHSAVDLGGRLRALDRLYDADWLTLIDIRRFRRVIAAAPDRMRGGIAIAFRRCRPRLRPSSAPCRHEDLHGARPQSRRGDHLESPTGW